MAVTKTTKDGRWWAGASDMFCSFNDGATMAGADNTNAWNGPSGGRGWAL